MYWMSFIFILKCVFDVIRLLSFRFLWERNMEKGIAWVIEKQIALPEAEGEWGIQIIRIFN